jgi:predicted PurR-regulated permease PerM
MSDTTDLTDIAASSPGNDGTGDRETTRRDGGRRPVRVPKLGVWAWSFVGAVVAAVIVVVALGAVSEIVLPLTFAAVLAVIFKPLVGILQRHGFRPTLAAGTVVLGLLVLMGGVVVATVKGVTEQADQISVVTDEALNTAADDLDAAGVDQAALADARTATEGAAPMIGTGFLTKVVSGIGSVIGLVSGLILGALIMYYLLKDGTSLRRNLVAKIRDPGFRGEVDDFIGDTCRILRDYGQARTIMSAIVAAFVGLVALLLGLPLVFTIIVVNFVGGYIPYIGAFLGGGLAVIVALGDGGLGKAVVMLVAVLASNLILENFVEPKVMSRSLSIHPLVVLIVTALGGLLGGMVGLILAVPAYVIAQSAFSRFRSKGIVEKVADRAQPAVQRLIE